MHPRSSSVIAAALPVAAAFGAWALLPPRPADANGNVSHQWITKQAVLDTPRGGSLRGLVGDETLVDVLHTGTMFPDWGYTPGASSEERDAGEASHWEYVQEAYRLWIMATYQPPWNADARRHIAFYMGMTSHGMADQTYDAMFFERSRFYENKDHGSFDQESDVMWAATTGPGDVPTQWLPEAVLLGLFDDLVGVTIDGDSMKQKVGVVGFAIAAVNSIASNPDNVLDAEAEYPWAAAHDDDPATPGNPPAEAEAVRRYWRSNWALLHGDALPRPVLWTYPEDGGSEHAVESVSIESWISVVFARGIDEQALDVSQFHVVDSLGDEAPITIDLFYGNSSHVVHLVPTTDLLDDEIYVVTIDPGILTIHGESLEGWSFTFSTGADAPPPLHDDDLWNEPDPYGGDGDGDGDGEPDGDADADADAGDDAEADADSADDQATDDVTDAGDASDQGADDASGSGESSGCACAMSPGSPPHPARVLSLLALAVLASTTARRRRA